MHTCQLGSGMGCEGGSPAGAKSTRHLCNCVSASSYYPLYPPQEDVPLDLEHFYSFAQLPLTPDMLIVPSELRYFVKVGLLSSSVPCPAPPTPPVWSQGSHKTYSQHPSSPQAMHTFATKT